jgi:hypothetical protein
MFDMILENVIQSAVLPVMRQIARNRKLKNSAKFA